MGNDSAVQQNVSKITNIQFTPTRTIYVMTAGPLNLTVTFLSPIEVNFLSRLRIISYVIGLTRLLWDTAGRLGEAIDAVVISVCRGKLS